MALPLPPSNFAVQQGNGQVWITASLVAGATSYPIERSLDNVTFSALASPTIPQYLDTTVTQGVEYWYRLASNNGTDTSNFTSSLSVVPVQPGLMTLGQIRLLSKQKADRVNSQFVTDSEWNVYINQSAFELYDILTTRFEDYNVAPPALFQTTGNSDQYALPDGITPFIDSSGSPIVPPPFYKLLGIDMGLALGDNAWVTLHKFNFISRNRFVYPNLTSTYLGVFNLRYRVMGNNILFIPAPSGAQFLRIWYVPRMTQLLKDTDILDGVSGWTEYVVIDAAIKALQKEESDVSVLMVQKQAILDRIETTASNRDAGMPDTISNTRSFGESWGQGGPGFDGSYGGY